jgi:hypothetical protein
MTSLTIVQSLKGLLLSNNILVQVKCVPHTQVLLQMWAENVVANINMVIFLSFFSRCYFSQTST